MTLNRIDRRSLSETYGGSHELVRWHEEVHRIVSTPTAPSGTGAALPTGGLDGDVLKRTGTGYVWGAQAAGLPSGGFPGEVVTKTSSGAVWAAPAASQVGGPAALLDLGDSGPYGGAFFDLGRSL